MQSAMNQVLQAFENYFTISMKKTGVVYQPAPGKPYSKPTITENDTACKLMNLHAWKALCPEWCKIDEATTRTAKVSVILADYVKMSGIEV